MKGKAIRQYVTESVLTSVVTAENINLTDKVNVAPSESTVAAHQSSKSDGQAKR
jgi:sorbitol-specific phosphotransferase system component IIBC